MKIALAQIEFSVTLCNAQINDLIFIALEQRPAKGPIKAENEGLNTNTKTESGK